MKYKEGKAEKEIDLTAKYFIYDCQFKNFNFQGGEAWEKSPDQAWCFLSFCAFSSAVEAITPDKNQSLPVSAWKPSFLPFDRRAGKRSSSNQLSGRRKAGR
jgi:hypothetical protein